MAKPPQQPKQVELDLTASSEPGEGKPGERAIADIRRDRFNFKIALGKAFGVEADLEESVSNPQSAAVLHFLMITISAALIITVVWAISRSTVIGLIAGGLTMVTAVVFVRTTRGQNPPKA